ncbi:MAG: LysE family translocator [Bacteroidetes bacterium]|nr:MAG: LysE family translocator [Bacteroidota bacterium]
MSIIWQGIQLGFVLAILVGPLLVVLIQVALVQGTRAGLQVGLGIWVSDLLYILGVYFGLRYLDQAAAWPPFETVTTLAGALVVLATGLLTIFTPPPQLDLVLATKGNRHNIMGPFKLWLKGFLINTINPFPIFFWGVVVMKGIVLESDYTPKQSALLFSTIMGVIVFTDSVKVVLAKSIRHWLKPHHLLWVRRISGLILCGIAVGLVWKVWSQAA